MGRKLNNMENSKKIIHGLPHAVAIAGSNVHGCEKRLEYEKRMVVGLKM